ncbi:outer membrane protein assembly factor BamE (plasmid) [Brevibacillus halotolerans]|nr:outer membrane protein assembly factor BamE [Brevibacillus halotolerans]
MFYEEYPNVTKAKVEAIHVGMTKEEVDKALGTGREEFLETEKGRTYTSVYKSIENNDYRLVYIKYDEKNKVSKISF